MEHTIGNNAGTPCFCISINSFFSIDSRSWTRTRSPSTTPSSSRGRPPPSRKEYELGNKIFQKCLYILAVQYYARLHLLSKFSYLKHTYFCQFLGKFENGFHVVLLYTGPVAAALRAGVLGRRVPQGPQGGFGAPCSLFQTVQRHETHFLHAPCVT